MKKILGIILANIIIFFALLLMHEIAHALIGSYLGCKQIKIVFDMAEGPHTELNCPSRIDGPVYMSGLVTTALSGSLFLLLKSPSKNLFFVSLGLSLIFSALDLSILFSLELVFYSLISFGFGFVTVGEYLMTSRTMEAGNASMGL